MQYSTLVMLPSFTDSATGTTYGSALDASQMIQGSAIVTITQTTTGVTSGTFVIQVSNDLPSTLTTVSGAYVPTNWATLSSSSVAATGTQSAVVLLSQMAYRWIRAGWVHGSDTGSGSVSCNFTYMTA